MRKFYFFELKSERNAQGEYWKVLHALPGQTTYLNCRERNAPVDPALKVQVTRDENHYVVGFAPGAIFAVCYESSYDSDLRLPVYSRNGVQFYRTEGRLYAVNGVIGNESREIPQHVADAWNEFHRPETAAPAPASSPAERPAPEAPSAPSPSSASGTPAPEVSVPGNELNLIEDALRSSGRFSGESAVLTQLLLISRLRDRMRSGVVRFVFIKQNGDMRQAVGTRNRDCIESVSYSGAPGGSRGTGNDGAHFCYFDIEKSDWRCFCVEDLRSANLSEVIVDPDEIRAIRFRFASSHPRG